MNREYRPSRQRRLFIGLGAVVFTIFGSSSACFAFDLPFDHPYLFAASAVLHFTFAAWCAVGALTYRRNRVVINNDQIMVYGLRRRHLKFADVLSARWYPQMGGVLSMRTAATRIRVSF